MNDKAKAPKQEEFRNAEEINLDDLEQVTGAGNPFEDIPRVKTHDYDDDIKEKI
ncbi:MAG: hypothetical protein ACI4SS_06115 [Clostridia bacterium]